MPPLVAASLLGVPSDPARAERRDGPRQPVPQPAASSLIAAGFPDSAASRRAEAKLRYTGNPVRPAVLAAAATPYPDFADGRLRVLVTGGSQGARVMSEVVPGGAGAAQRRRSARGIRLTLQARGEDRARAAADCERLGFAAEIAEFFPDLPARIAAAHLVVGRAGRLDGRANSRSSAAPRCWCPIRTRSTRTRPPTPRRWREAARRPSCGRPSSRPNGSPAILRGALASPDDACRLRCGGARRWRSGRRRAPGRPPVRDREAGLNRPDGVNPGFGASSNGEPAHGRRDGTPNGAGWSCATWSSIERRRRTARACSRASERRPSRRPRGSAATRRTAPTSLFASASPFFWPSAPCR